MSLSARIMNLPASGEPAGGSMAYNLGHRDARHAAAELAAEADAIRDELVTALERILANDKDDPFLTDGERDQSNAAIARAKEQA